jgi:hypothetical protein
VNTRLLLIACILVAASGSARSQGGVDGYPFDTPADSRSVAMGESFVGLPSNPAALMYNYTFPAMHDQSAINDSLSVGLSFQNIWTQRDVTVGGRVVQTEIPEYFRN